MQTITKEMSIGEVLKIDRNTAPVFMTFGMHCLGCPHATAESIADAAIVHGVNPDQIVAALNEFLAAKKV